MAVANAGTPTVLIDVNQEALDRGLSVVRKNYEVTVQRGRMTPEELEQRMGLITGAVGLEGARVAPGDVVLQDLVDALDAGEVQQVEGTARRLDDRGHAQDAERHEHALVEQERGRRDHEAGSQGGSGP